jgi:PKD domain
MRRRPLATLVAIACLSVPAGASAATYCVNTPVNCVGTDYTQLQLQAALTDATNAPGTNDVVIDAGFYIGPFTVGEDVNVTGAGADSTVLTNGSVNGGVALSVTAGATTISDLGIRVTGGTGTPGALLLQSGNVAHHILASTDGVAPAVAVTLLTGSTLRNATVDTIGADLGISANANVTIEDTILRGHGTGTTAIAHVGNGTASIRRSRIDGYAQGIRTQGAAAPGTGRLVITDTLVDLGALPGAHAITAPLAGNTTNRASMNVVRTTIIGSGASQIGAYATAEGGTATVTLTVVSSLVYLTGPALASVGCYAATAQTPVTVTASGNALRPGTPTGGGQCSPIAGGTLNLAATDPKLRNIAGRDYTPRYDSPLIDLGSSVVPAPALDVFGRPRVVEGNGGGSPAAKADLGAIEYQRTPPTVSLGAPVPGSPTAGESVALTATTGDADGEPVTVTWAFGDGATATGASVSHAYTGAGTFTVVATATDAAGATKTATLQLVVTPAPGGDTIAPTLSALKGPTTPFRRTKTSFRLVTKGPRTIRGTVSEPARLRLTLERRNAKGRYVKLAGSKTLKNVGAGAFRIAFGGRFAGKLLRPGRYRITITAIDPAGNASKTRRRPFRLR